MSEKRTLYRPPYKQMYAGLLQDNERLRKEIRDLRREVKSLKTEREAKGSAVAYSKFFDNNVSSAPVPTKVKIDPYPKGIDYDQAGEQKPIEPLFAMPPKKSWWERLWGVT